MLETDIPPNLMHDCRDAGRLNEVVNDPAVRPFIGAPEAGVLDMAPLVADPNNLFPFGEHGGFALIWSGPKSYEVHTFILRKGRGFWAKLAAREGIEMARERGAKVLWTRVPCDLPHVRAFSIAMGMAATGESSQMFGKRYDVLSMDIASCL